ncbi:hypothetical protein [Nocardiopsis synnemataformans]|uniref:hypothetical protein n=1 Tax=Nocardiopsis synnemataformans TaxID=61305 RepID=UPI003EB70823
MIRPGPVWLLERVVAAREAAKAETFQRIEPLLTPVLRLDLDGLLRVDPAVGSSRPHWLSHGATQASPNAVNAEVAKLEYLRSLDAHALDVSVLPTERRRHLATIGRCSTAQSLERRDPEVRYPIDVDKELSKLDAAGYRPLRRLGGRNEVLWGSPG